MLRASTKAIAKQVLVRATRGRMFWHGPRTPRRAAITFDDGPNEQTDAYLDVLAHYGVAATFFVMGNYVESLPDAMTHYRRGGHQVAGHGYFHERFTNLGALALRAELARMERALGPQPFGKWVRPPHGSIGARDVSVMLALGYTIAMWSFDSRDYDGASADVLVERCRPANVRPGEVLLFHEASATTLAALPRIIEGLQGDGYELVSMADLIAG
ncbi:MAG: polysaccharide deacetylase family protein [Kofleriaceae bacterium]